MTPEEIDKKLKILEEQFRYAKLAEYRPYEKQKEFHRLGATKRERLLRAGNQLGKTFCGAAEMAYHLTGLYPKWWEGKRWDRPINAWAGGPSGEATRDSVQRNLLGRVGDFGTGAIPKDCIVETVNARGVADLLDYVIVRHVSGKNSTIKFKNYEQGRDKWQGDTLDLVWFDEEPPEEIYSEGLTRTNATGGIAYITFTPLLGMTNVIRKFLIDATSDRSDTNITIKEALHIPEELRQRIIDSYPKHEREARINGTPMLGSGLVFPIDRDAVAVEAFPIPDHWAKLGGIDFGGAGEDGHPTAAVKIAHDREGDVVYVVSEYRKKGGTITQHAQSLKGFGDNLLFVWPHDGLIKDRGSADEYWKQYRDAGLNMQDYRITFEDGGNGVEAGLMLMLERFETGRLKIFSHLTGIFEELGLFHRKDGVLVKLNDDIISSLRYAIMGLRFANTKVKKPILTFEDVLYKQLEMSSRGGTGKNGGWMGA